MIQPYSIGNLPSSNSCESWDNEVESAFLHSNLAKIGMSDQLFQRFAGPIFTKFSSGLADSWAGWLICYDCVTIA